MQARQIVQKLLVGRFAFTPGEDPEGRYYEFAGQGALDKLLAGIIRPSSVVTPAGRDSFSIPLNFVIPRGLGRWVSSQPPCTC